MTRAKKQPRANNALNLRPTDERYTPRVVLDPLVQALGAIAYDPCTMAANPVGATSFSALPENGLEQDWNARAQGGLTWVNMPFSKMRVWTRACVEQADRGAELAILTPVDPSTDWYATLFARADIAAQLGKRVRYIAPADQPAINCGAMQPTMIWYIGPRVAAFIRAFEGRAHFIVPGLLRQGVSRG